jgi:hypothetical protein
MKKSRPESDVLWACFVESDFISYKTSFETSSIDLMFDATRESSSGSKSPLKTTAEAPDFKLNLTFVLSPTSPVSEVRKISRTKLNY